MLFSLVAGTNRMSRNVGNYQLILRNMLEEWQPELYRVGSLKSCLVMSC